MNEIIEEIKLLRHEIKHLTSEIEQLKALVLSDKTNAQWISEKEAALLLGLKGTRTLRKMAKGGLVDYTQTNGRTYQYSRKSINKFLESNSTIISPYRR